MYSLFVLVLLLFNGYVSLVFTLGGDLCLCFLLCLTFVDYVVLLGFPVLL